MNNSNPLIPQGSLQPARGKSNVRIAFFTIVAIHVFFLGGALMQGCGDKKPNASAQSGTPTNDVVIAPMPTSVVETAVQSATNPVNPLASNPPPIAATPVTGAPAIETPAPSGGREHVVIKNDTFATIAKKYGVSVKSVQEANPAVQPTKLRIGQKLQIPGGASATAAVVSATASDSGDSTTYVVKASDNLSKIAKSHGTSIKAIRSLNNLKSDRINVGQKLKLPAGRGAVVASTPAVTAPEPAPAGTLPVVTNRVP
jgi:LysM repeat protein